MDSVLGNSKDSQSKNFVNYWGLSILQHSLGNTNTQHATPPWVWAMYAVFPKPIHSGTSFIGWLDSWLVGWLVG